MKSILRYAVLIITCTAIFSEPAFSIDIGGIGGINSEKEKPVTPPQYNVPLPAAPAPPKPAQEIIPTLPPSLPCKPHWLFGLWVLEHVYEAPPGPETQAYIQSPVQYVAFGEDSRFARLNAGATQLDPHMVLKQMTDHSGALLQFLLQDGGMLYLYQDRNATDTLVCFIVAEARPPYAAGNLLLMPPKGKIPGRMVKVYKKIWSPPKQNNAPNPRANGKGRPAGPQAAPAVVSPTVPSAVPEAGR